MNIRIEDNPNPNSKIFVTEKILISNGQSYDYPSQESAKDAPLAQKIFVFDYVENVFFMNNFITLTIKEGTKWDTVIPVMKILINEYISSGQAVINENTQEQGASSDIEAKIIAVLDEYVKPAVEKDGGAITFDSFDAGIVKVKLQGACNGCPSATITLKSGIETLLKRIIPEVKTVEAVNM